MFASIEVLIFHPVWLYRHVYPLEFLKHRFGHKHYLRNCKDRQLLGLAVLCYFVFGNMQWVTSGLEEFFNVSTTFKKFQPYVWEFFGVYFLGVEKGWGVNWRVFIKYFWCWDNLYIFNIYKIDTLLNKYAVNI